ncbi:MAG: formylmethanofuran dehydrogenase subunit B [Euryarchaeota archaeon]|nr:formylmethanofuran dehydrogenase subunit B [Euryarchaeota archaeon]
MACTGCALLCEDIDVHDGEVRPACRIGAAHILSRQQIDPMVNHEVVSIDDAIKRAAALLADAERPIFLGFGNSVTETQETGVRLAEKIGAGIDTCSSHASLIDDIVHSRVKTCTLPEVRDMADVILFWGADPMNTHPRLLSGYAYYPRGKNRQHGWEEDRTAITIDVRRSHTASICKGVHKIVLGHEAEFADALMLALRNKVPKTVYDSKQVLKLAGTLKKAEFGVIFAGPGLVESVPRDAIVRLMDKLNEFSDFRILPLHSPYNLRSIAAVKTAAIVNPTTTTTTTDAAAAREQQGISTSTSKPTLARLREADCLLCVGFDLISSLPQAHDINASIIVIDPNETLTAGCADVVIPCAAGGVDIAGTAVRLDGAEIDLPRITMETGQAGAGIWADTPARMSDASIMNQLLEAM